MNATGLPRFLLDLRTPPSGVVQDWLGAQHGKREALIGDGEACFDDFRLEALSPS